MLVTGESGTGKELVARADDDDGAVAGGITRHRATGRVKGSGPLAAASEARPPFPPPTR